MKRKIELPTYQQIHDKYMADKEWSAIETLVDECSDRAIHKQLLEALQEAYDQGYEDARPKWLPIESAPKDGTWIRLWREPEEIGISSPEVIAVYNAPTEYMSKGVWMWPDDVYDPYTDRGRKLALNEIAKGDFYESDSFTHWMPLPEPPTR